MNENGGFFTDGTRYIILGIFFILMVGILMMPKPRTEQETWIVEVHIISKEIVEIDEEAVYLLHTEDSAGNEAVYQITQKALNSRIKAENAYKEIRKGKYYQFRVADGAEYGCQYPCVRGAATLIEGFSEETTAAK